MKIVTKIILPFRLPIQDGFHLVSNYCFGQIHICFSTIEAKTDFEAQDIIPNRSVLDVTCFPKEVLSRIEDRNELLRSFVSNIISYINHFISALRIEYRLSYLQNITTHDLPKILVIFVNDEGSIYFIDDFLYEHPDFDVDAMQKVLSTMTLMELYPGTYLVDEFYHSALSELRKENFNRFIVDIETSFEIFIRNTLRLVMIRNGTAEGDVENAAFFPFRNAIEQHLARYLDENLSFEENTIINTWYQNVYMPRNQLVHKGIPIDFVVAGKAVEAYHSAQQYITDLLIRNSYLDAEGKFEFSVLWGQRDMPNPEGIIERMQAERLIPQDLDFGN